MKNIQKKILLVFIYCVLFLLCLEGSARFILLYTPFLDSKTIRSDPYFRLKLVRASYHKDKESFLSGNYLYEPLRGWALKPNLNIGNAGRPDKILHTNSKGIRGVSEYTYQKQSSKKRILILGDSFTFGDEASDNVTYPYYLEKMVPGLEVLNFGVNGYGHDQMLLYLKEEGIRYKPDIVVLGFAPTGLSRNMSLCYRLPKPKFVLVDNKLQLTNVPVPTISSIISQEIFKPKIIDWLLMIQAEHGDKTHFIKERKQLTEAIFDEMLKTIRECGAKPLFVYISTPLAMSKNNPKEEKPFEDFFEQFCKERNIPHLFTRPYFNAVKQKGIQLKKIGHWDAQGNQIVAQVIAEYLCQGKMKTASQ